MMPCPKCFPVDEKGGLRPFDHDGNPVNEEEVIARIKTARGLKKVSKTKRSAVERPAWGNQGITMVSPHAIGESFYRCQDCGSLFRSTFNTVDKTLSTVPVFTLIEGGSEQEDGDDE